MDKYKEFKRAKIRKTFSRQEAWSDASNESRFWFRRGQELFDEGIRPDQARDSDGRMFHPIKLGAMWMGWQAANLVNKGYQPAARGTAYYHTEPHDLLF